MKELLDVLEKFFYCLEESLGRNMDIEDKMMWAEEEMRKVEEKAFFISFYIALNKC